DGTPVSMFLVRRGRESFAVSASAGSTGSASASTQKLQTTPDPEGSVLLTGYGGFNISLTPSFDPSDFLWLDAGGVLAVANLRGGGEYGDAWHRAGMRERKQTVFDDFIGAAVCRVPVADMLRYHLFTVGRFWIPEYGCADRAEDFAFLYRYSPYHNVRDGVPYPPTLVMTADTDDRVAPGMATKFAARLQQATAGADGGSLDPARDRPILLRVETRAGHGAGKSIARQIDEQGDLCAFLFKYLTRTSASEQLRR